MDIAKIKRINWKRLLLRRRNRALILLIILVLIGIAVSTYFIIFYGQTCYNSECFKEALIKCQRANYIADKPETILSYEISGRSGDSCKINVKMLQVKKGSAEIAVLEGKSMICLTPFGSEIRPEDNIKYCHGLLKENIQEIIIQRMHSQILENIGIIKEEFTKII